MSGIFSIGEIHFTNNPSALIPTLISGIKEQNLRIYDMDNLEKESSVLKIKTAREIIAQSYISSIEQKLIIISAKEYNIEAQNALLKILEEPPINIKFILIAKNKNAILPTIRSRLISYTHKNDTINMDFDIDIKKLNMDMIYEYCKKVEQKPSSKDEIREKIQRLLFALKSMDFRFDSMLLKAFDNAIFQNQNDEREAYIFLPLLLRIYLIKKENTK